eukprot:1113086-Rhodomonas_salina.1
MDDSSRTLSNYSCLTNPPLPPLILSTVRRRDAESKAGRGRGHQSRADSNTGHLTSQTTEQGGL